MHTIMSSEFSGSFWIAIATIGSVSLAGLIDGENTACSNLSLCGCINVQRDIDGENTAYRMEIENPPSPRPTDFIPLPNSNPSRRGSMNV